MNKSENQIVKIRRRKLKNGIESLYLDFAVNGIRHRKALKLYLSPLKTKKAKQKNIETIRRAQLKCAQTMVDLQLNTQKRYKLFEYYERCILLWQTNLAKKTIEKHKYALKKLQTHCKNIQISSVDKNYIISYLQKLNTEKIKDNSVITIFSSLKSVLNEAVRDEIIDNNPCNKLCRFEMPKKTQSTRTFLTEDELIKIKKTETPFADTKRVFLFSCYSGLRYSDLLNLKWENLSYENNDSKLNTWVNIKQQKTSTYLHVPLCNKAASLLPKRRNDKLKVFKIKSPSSVNSELKKIAETASINKNISFHVARHTFATLLISCGVDIYTTSKLLGHKSVSTTQIYAKLIDSKKEEAVNKIDEIE